MKMSSYILHSYDKKYLIYVLIHNKNLLNIRIQTHQIFCLNSLKNYLNMIFNIILAQLCSNYRIICFM